MKIVIAPDKFKNSLSGLEFCNAVEAGIRTINKEADILKLPLADGGDGTIEVVNFYLKGEVVRLKVNNPFFKPVEATYLYAETSKTAFIEMAEASGVKLLQAHQLDCKNATTLGTGEMIVDALERGAETIILGIGGSATNDCGIGMATALGYRFLDKNNNEVVPTGTNLSKIVAIEVTNVHPKISEVTFRVACDVTNPLYGPHGAAYVYAAQKGATKEDIQMLDQGLRSFSKTVQNVFGVEVQSIKGAGAAGGMGMASQVFLKGTLEPGIALLKTLANFDEQIKGAGLIITGEGKLDAQTFSGKTIHGVLGSAKKQHITVAALCGSISLNSNEIKTLGIAYTDAVIDNAKSLGDAMQNSYAYVKKMAQKLAQNLLV